MTATVIHTRQTVADILTRDARTAEERAHGAREAFSWKGERAVPTDVEAYAKMRTAQATYYDVLAGLLTATATSLASLFVIADNNAPDPEAQSYAAAILRHLAPTSDEYADARRTIADITSSVDDFTLASAWIADYEAANR